MYASYMELKTISIDIIYVPMFSFNKPLAHHFVASHHPTLYHYHIVQKFDGENV